ncbi:SUKH-4 family immunity protein [Streptomyces platensis]|uniref:SUKH-4 family immunity protein n=1 Tax=Streptomyces platensis TaxID=58346 RepID=UPI001F1F6C85|nr:SUKH-4 family immunity protein [Streptomyces platensis]MCF3144091.1 SUKH-4 family immunity protein [Streptomyces platensis]
MTNPAPEPQAVSPDVAVRRSLLWIDKPRERTAWLWIGGEPGTGKTELLRTVAGRAADSVFVDCSGRPVEEIAQELAERCGAAQSQRYDTGFADAVRHISRNFVVLLANTQRAGRLRTTAEPQRVVGQLVDLLRRYTKPGVALRLLVEVEDAPAAVASYAGRQLTLSRAADTGPAPERPASGAARALALAETREVPLPVWSLLCSATGDPHSEQQLQELIAGDTPTNSSWHKTCQDDLGTSVVSLRHESMAAEFRGSLPVDESRAMHQRIYDALSAAPEDRDSVRNYSRTALPGHAAAAGLFDSLLGDLRLLAQVDHRTLFEAFESVYFQRPVPLNSQAFRLRYLAERGVVSSSPGEWLALLHHSLMMEKAERNEEGERSEGNEGRGDRGHPSGPLAASQLWAATPRIRAPWRTLWADGTAPGTLTTWNLVRRPHVRRLQVAETSAGEVAAAWDPQGNLQAWSMERGDRLTVSPKVDRSASGQILADQGLSGWRPAGEAEGAVDIPRMPRFVRRAARRGNRAVMASEDGVFVIDIDPEESAQQAPGVLKNMIRTTTKPGSAPLPPEASRPTPAWYASVWPAGTFRRMPATALPHGITHTETRAFLTETGLPFLRGDFLELSVLDLSTEPLEEADWADMPSPVSPHRTADAAGGPYYRLGAWQGARLLLEGGTGRVLQDGASGLTDALAATSLRNFVLMVRLYYWWFASDWSVDDLEPTLQEWLSTVDAEAFTSDCWQRVFGDADFSDRV